MIGQPKQRSLLADLMNEQFRRSLIYQQMFITSVIRLIWNIECPI